MTRSDLDQLVRWFEQRHGHALGIRPDAGYRIDRLGGRRGTSERFRAFAAMHMLYFGSSLLATREPLRELAYLPLDKRRFVEGWFQRWLEPDKKH